MMLAACGGSTGGNTADAPTPAATDSPSTVTEAVPLGSGAAGDDMVQFVRVTTTTTTTTSTSTTEPPTTTTSTTTSTSTSTTTTTTSTTTTTTTTTVPPPASVRCSFAADALFEPSSVTLTPGAVAELTALAERVLRDAGDEVIAVQVEGHTDHRGSDADNQALSDQRAAAAAAVLTGAGIPAAVVTATGFGETAAHQPSGTGPTDAEMAADRRVDIVIDAEIPLATSC